MDDKLDKNIECGCRYKKIFKPIVFEICLTSACNLQCIHCYQHYDKNKYYLSKKVVLDIIYKLVEDFNAKRLVLTGGEVFIYTNFYSLIDIIHKKYIDKLLSLSIMTNGTLIDVNKVRKWDNKKVKFSISIDGFERDHDLRRGKGSFRKAIQNANRLISMGFDVNANVTLDSKNVLYIDKLIDYLLNDVQFTTITILAIGSGGAAGVNKKKLGLTEKLYSSIIREIYKTIKPSIKDRCNTFPYSISIKYDGNVYPCSVARDFSVMKMGNILKDNIESIIHRFIKSSEGIKLLNYKSYKQITECKHCEYNNICKGGCRMRAFKWFGDIYCPDPFGCAVYKEKFSNYCLSDIYWGNK